MFLGWFDDTPKKATQDKLAEALERYGEKFGDQPNLVLVNAKDAIEYPGLEVRTVEYVRPNHFWIGKREALPAN